MHLVLWRHAEAEDGDDDLARRLTPRGEKQAERVGRWLRDRLPEHYRLIASPAERTRQTARGLSANIEIVDALAPGATPSAILRASGWPSGDGAVVVVGHQPTLGQAAALLMTGAAQAWSVKRGAAWWFEHRAHRGDLTLRAVIAPDHV